MIEKIKEKICISLAKECYSMKLTNATVVDDAIRFVPSQRSKEKVESMNSSNEDHSKSNEPDYDEDKYHLEEKKKLQPQ